MLIPETFVTLKNSVDKQRWLARIFYFEFIPVAPGVTFLTRNNVN